MKLTRRGVLAGGAAMATGAARAGADGSEGLPAGFSVPPEEAPHELTFMQWPVSRRVYRDPVFLEMTQRAILAIANAIAAFEPVVMLAHPGDMALPRRHLSAAVTLWDIPTDDLWARDAGAIVARAADGRRAASGIRFNGWGSKQVHRRDGAIAQEVAVRLGLPWHPAGLTGEAGGVEQDGHGMLIAHASSWVTANRNPGLTQDQIGARLLAAYGAERILWSPGVPGLDITDYHIDSLARLTAPGRALVNLPRHPDPGDPFHAAALETATALRAAGLAVEVIDEPIPPGRHGPDFVASYVNYYVLNGAVVAPRFGDRDADDAAAAALARHYPGREIVMLDAGILGELGGGIHCATHELPAG